MVGPTPGELCRTQAPTTAGSGDLQPKFDEEACAPLWCKMSVLPFLTSAVLQVLVNVKPKPLVSPQRHLVTKPAIELLSDGNFSDQAKRL